MRKRIGALLIAAALVLLPLPAAAHPANIPVARAKVAVDGTIEFTVSFDVLAFVLDQTPELVLDKPMNGLLDGPAKDLQVRLTAAKQRFLEGFSIGDASAPGVVDACDFPSAADIHKVIDAGQTPRLPVMMTATLECHVRPGERKVSFQFPDVMGPVVLTVEFPYIEPISQSIDPGESSEALDIPTQTQVDALAESMHISKPAPEKPKNQLTEAEARKGIQRQYDAWTRAYMGHDVDTLLGILAPAYKLKTAQGTLINYSEYVAMLKLRKQKRSDTTLYRQEIVRITLRDGVAAVWSRETTTDPGLNQKTGKPQPVTYRHDYVDLWINVNGRWLLKSTATQKEQIVAAPSKAPS